MNDLMYRYSCWHNGGGNDEEGYYCWRQTHLSCTVYRIVKRTEKGVWVVEGESESCITSSFPNKPRFVLLEARRRLCYATKADALISFMARKKKRIKFLRRDIEDLERAIEIAQRELAAYKL